MTSSLSEAPLTLVLSPRDVQWIAASLGVVGSLLNCSTSAEQVEDNLDALHTLLHLEYSDTEANALMHRSRALLPAGTRLEFVDQLFMLPPPSAIVQ